MPKKQKVITELNGVVKCHDLLLRFQTYLINK